MILNKSIHFQINIQGSLPAAIGSHARLNDNGSMRPERHTCHATVVVTGNPGRRTVALASGEKAAGYLLVALGDEAPVRLYLHQDWAELLDYCWPGAQLGLRHVRCRVAQTEGAEPPVVR